MFVTLLVIVITTSFSSIFFGYMFYEWFSFFHVISYKFLNAKSQILLFILSILNIFYSTDNSYFLKIFSKLFSSHNLIFQMNKNCLIFSVSKFWLTLIFQVSWIKNNVSFFWNMKVRIIFLNLKIIHCKTFSIFLSLKRVICYIITFQFIWIKNS